MTRTHLTANRSDAGYTLIELMISLAILALLISLVPSTLRLGRRAWETPGQFNETPATAALAFAVQNLKGALPVYQRDSSGLQHLVFEGSEQTVSFVAELTNGPMGGGLYRMTLGTALRLSLYRPDGPADAPGAEDRDLSSTYSTIKLRYFGPPSPGESAQWLDRWPRTDRLPDLVDIDASPRSSTAIPPFRMRAELKLKPML